jgi:hypothetical protein
MRDFIRHLITTAFIKLIKYRSSTDLGIIKIRADVRAFDLLRIRILRKGEKKRPIKAYE